MIKLSNIWVANKSTIIGLVITGVTIIYEALKTGPLNWQALGTAFAGSALLALTNILKEEEAK